MILERYFQYAHQTPRANAPDSALFHHLSEFTGRALQSTGLDVAFEQPQRR